MQHIIQMDWSRRGRNYGMTNILYHHTSIIRCMHLLLATVVLLCCQPVEITCDVISSGTICVPSWIKGVRRGRRICRLVQARVVLIESFPTPKSSMTQLAADLTLMITVGVVGIVAATSIATNKTTLPPWNPPRLCCLLPPPPSSPRATTLATSWYCSL
jgi:hypothetical protein